MNPTQESGVRLFVRDAIEAAIASVSGLWVGGSLGVIPSLDSTKAAGLAALFAGGAAIVAVARRELLPLILDAISPKSGG